MWYGRSRMKEADLHARLERVGIPKIAIYSIGCASHAMAKIVASKTPPHEEPLLKAAGLLETFWGSYPNILRADILHRMVVEAAELLPIEGIPEYQPGTPDLLSSTAYGLSSAEKTEC